MSLKNLIIKSTCILLLLMLSFYTIVIASEYTYIWSDTYALEKTLQTNANESESVQNSNSLNLESGSAILIEQNSGQILYEHNCHEHLRPASVTKVMSVLLIMEAIDSGKISLEDKVPCSSNASSMGGSQIWLNETEELTVNEMLKAICVVSANDCTVQL